MTEPDPHPDDFNDLISWATTKDEGRRGPTPSAFDELPEPPTEDIDSSVRSDRIRPTRCSATTGNPARWLFNARSGAGDITPEKRYRTRLLAIRKIVGQSPEMRERLGDYPTDAEALAAQ
jgi:hypothetical protein